MDDLSVVSGLIPVKRSGLFRQSARGKVSLLKSCGRSVDSLWM